MSIDVWTSQASLSCASVAISDSTCQALVLLYCYHHDETQTQCAQVQSAASTFDPPIRRHVLADLVVEKVNQDGMLPQLVAPCLATHALRQGMLHDVPGV
jgi:hypothetical protein